MSKRLKKYVKKLSQIDEENYTFVRYFLYPNSKKSNLLNLATEIAIGQSVGNPYLKSNLESNSLIEKYGAMVISNLSDNLTKKMGYVTIAFPQINSNFEKDGLNHFMCQIQGGNLDINSFKVCQVKSIKFSNKTKKKLYLKKPGINGIRNFLKIKDNPLAGAIIKPKVGLTPNKLLDVVKNLVDGGANIIKEDEILSDPTYCSLEKRSEIITNYLQKLQHKVVYLFCINSDPLQTFKKFKHLSKIGANGVHLNFWSGLGMYRNLRQLNKKIFILYQKSGERIITNKKNNFNISFSALVDLVSFSGVDIMHAGMIKGYTDDTLKELKIYSSKLQNNNIFPSFSCGLRPEHIKFLYKNFTNNFVANSGSFVNAHPNGPKEGINEIVKSILKLNK